MKKIQDFLQQLGLTETEATLYQGLLGIGSASVKELAEHVGVKRITVHFNIESLIKKELVIQSIKGVRRTLLAEPPDHLEYLITKKIENAKKLQYQLNDILKIIKVNFPQVNDPGNRVKIKYYEGKKDILSFYNESLKSNNYYSFADLDRYYEIFPDTNVMWNKALEVNPKREVWDIVIDSPLARKIVGESSKRYHVKFIPRSESFFSFKFSDFIIFDDKLAIVQLDNNDIAATVIDSKHITLSFKAIHQSMWQLLPDPHF